MEIKDWKPGEMPAISDLPREDYSEHRRDRYYEQERQHYKDRAAQREAMLIHAKTEAEALAKVKAADLEASLKAGRIWRMVITYPSIAMSAIVIITLWFKLVFYLIFH